MMSVLTMQHIYDAMDKVGAFTTTKGINLIVSPFVGKWVDGIVPIKLRGRGITIQRRQKVFEPILDIIQIGENYVCHPITYEAIKNSSNKES